MQRVYTCELGAGGGGWGQNLSAGEMAGKSPLGTLKESRGGKEA